MAKPLRADRIQLGLVIEFLQGAADPSAGAGVEGAAPTVTAGAGGAGNGNGTNGNAGGGGLYIPVQL